MSRSIHRAAAAIGLVAASTLGAVAADYDPPVVQEAAEYVPVEVGSGWYLRGDVTYNMSKSVYDLDPNVPGVDARNIRFGGGGGIGYHFTDYLRADLNLGFVGLDRYAYTTPGFFVEAKNEQWLGMANAYVDLGTIAGFTPYVGAGAGVLHSRAEATATDLFGGSISESDNQTEFAYTLNAGLAYQLTRNTSVDLGYQYLNSPGTDYIDAGSGGTAKGIDYHQVKLGLRYDLW